MVVGKVHATVECGFGVKVEISANEAEGKEIGLREDEVNDVSVELRREDNSPDRGTPTPGRPWMLEHEVKEQWQH